MKKTICQHCAYEWETSSDMKFVSCPNCLKKTIIANENSEEVREDDTNNNQ